LRSSPPSAQLRTRREDPYAAPSRFSTVANGFCSNKQWWLGPRFRGDDTLCRGSAPDSFFKQPAKQKIHVRDPAARCARGFARQCPSRIRGRRECRVPAAPAASRAEKEQKHTSVVTTGTDGSTDIPRAMVLRLIPCSPRRRIRLVTVTGGLKADQTRSSLISPPPAWHQQRVSEPHGFAVREKRRSSCTPAKPLTRFISPCDCYCAPDAFASTAS
jgi:hypothetical protein